MAVRISERCAQCELPLQEMGVGEIELIGVDMENGHVVASPLIY